MANTIYPLYLKEVIIIIIRKYLLIPQQQQQQQPEKKYYYLYPYIIASFFEKKIKLFLICIKICINRCLQTNDQMFSIWCHFNLNIVSPNVYISVFKNEQMVYYVFESSK